MAIHADSVCNSYFERTGLSTIRTHWTLVHVVALDFVSLVSWQLVLGTFLDTERYRLPVVIDHGYIDYLGHKVLCTWDLTNLWKVRTSFEIPTFSTGNLPFVVAVIALPWGTVVGGSFVK